MSLDPQEREQTRADLQRHLDASGLSRDELLRWLDISPECLQHAFEVDSHCHPGTVWLVRDALDETLHDAGQHHVDWAVLTDEARLRAEKWFVLRDLPPRP